VFTHQSSGDITHPSTNESTSTLASISITPEDVFQCLSNLDTTKVNGIDGMSAKVLRYCAGPLTPLVYHLFVLCIESCSLPAEWRTHLIVPIHKCGSKNNIKNYRPISLLCLLSKVLEKLIHQHVITFLSKSFSAAQFGFIPGRSSITYLH